jgi:hypothetical protein
VTTWRQDSVAPLAASRTNDQHFFFLNALTPEIGGRSAKLVAAPAWQDRREYIFQIVQRSNHSAIR